MPTVSIEVSAKNEGTESPYWLIIDPRQMMKPDAGEVSSMITGPFFSREDAQKHLDARHYAFSDRAVVWCASGYWSQQYKNAWRTAYKAHERK